MSIRHLIDKLLNKWPAKIVCLMLAIFLYIYNQVSLIEKKVFIIPLDIIQNGNVMQIGNCAETVSVLVRAQPDVINLINSTDLKASINLERIATSGQYNVPVEVKLDDKLMGYDPLEVRVKPENLNVWVEKKIAKYVEIKPSVSGNVAEGYQIKEITMNPSSIEIIGPESLVNNTDFVQTDALIVNNAEKNFSNEVNYLSVNKLLLVNNKGPYKATVVIEPKPMIKEYNGIHIVKKGLAETLEIENEIPDIDFSIGGTVPVLSKYILGANAVQINLEEIKEPGTYDVPVNIVLPSNFTLESQSIETIKIVVVERKEIPLQEEQTVVQ